MFSFSKPTMHNLSRLRHIAFLIKVEIIQSSYEMWLRRTKPCSPIILYHVPFRVISVSYVLSTFIFIYYFLHEGKGVYFFIIPTRLHCFIALACAQQCSCIPRALKVKF